MLRSVAAVVAGFATMSVLVMVGTMAAMAMLVPGGLRAMRQMAGPGAAEAMPAPSTRYYAMNIALSLVAAAVGGWITTRIALDATTGHLLALGILIVVMGLVSAFGPGNNRQPSWYKLLIPVAGLAGVALSALLTRPSV